VRRAYFECRQGQRWFPGVRIWTICTVALATGASGCARSQDENNLRAAKKAHEELHDLMDAGRFDEIGLSMRDLTEGERNALQKSLREDHGRRGKLVRHGNGAPACGPGEVTMMYDVDFEGGKFYENIKWIIEDGSPRLRWYYASPRPRDSTFNDEECKPAPPPPPPPG
jgi:hypothetical protein